MRLGKSRTVEPGRCHPGCSVTLLDTSRACVPDETTTHAERMLALIEAALEGRVPRGIEASTIDGQQITKMPIAQLQTLRAKYRAERAIELAAVNAAAGNAPRRTIGIRFVRP